jgi:predicted dehydrogenase
VLGANDRIQFGLIGCGERGLYVADIFQKTAEVDLRAVCDVFGERTAKAVAQAAGAQPFADHRRLLEMNGLEAVLIATPDHWHKAIAIDALNAGKDVYVEKPLTRLREEGPEIVRAARVEQSRVPGGHAAALRRGLPGSARTVRTLRHAGQDLARGLRLARRRQPGLAHRTCAEARQSGLGALSGAGEDTATGIPRSISISAPSWNSAAANSPILARTGSTWSTCSWIRMGLLSAVAAGGVYYDFHDGRTAPDTINALYEYPGGFTVSFISLAVDNGPEYHVEFLGSFGRLFINRNRYEFRAAEKGAEPVIRRFPGDITAQHAVRNFLDCCRSRKLPNADVYIGHRAAQAALLANQSYPGEAAHPVRPAAGGSSSAFRLEVTR